MRRSEWEHVIAAAANVTGEDEFVVVGSQAILGSFPDPPAPLLRSMEADIYPLKAPDKADDIDGALGDGSRFHEQFGYYAHGVGPETIRAPAGWEDRLVRVDVAPRPGSNHTATALCLEPHDLVLAKCAAHRDRDWEFAEECLRAGLVEADVLLARVPAMPVAPELKEAIRSTIAGVVGKLQRAR